MNKKFKCAFKSIALLFFFLFLSFQTKVYAAINYTASASTAVSNISFSSGYLALKVGGSTGTLSATVLPAEASNKAVTWSSSDETIAKISSSGVVTPVSEGIAVIKVKTVDGGHEDHCIVMVTKDPPVKVTGISLSQSQVTLKMDSKLALTPTISPSNATNKEVIWTSSDDTVATVNEKGIVTPLLPGVAVVRATTVDGNFSTFSVVYVFQGINKVTLSQSSLKLKVGDDGVILIATVNPDNVSVKEVKWTSSNPNVAIVGSNGVVIPVTKGSAVITATSLQDSTKSARCSVTVDTLPVKVNGIKLDYAQQSLKVGNTFTFKHTVSPSNAANKAVSWSSSDETIAKVNSSGVVTAVSKGIAIIKVKTVDGGYEYNSIVIVTENPPIRVTGISLPSNQGILKIGSKLTLTPTISPSNATNKEINWSSSDESVATVNDKGMVTPLLPGVVVIRATTADGDFSTFSVVYVVQGVNKVTLSQSSLKLKIGDGGVLLTATISPDNVSIKDVKWTSSNPTVAIVSSSGVVVPVSKGTAVITATSLQDSTKSAKCTVTVDTLPVKVTGVTLDSTQQALKVGNSLTLKHNVSPSNAANKAVVWSSSDETIAKVSSSGVVTAISKGIAIIKVKTVDGDYQYDCVIIITQDPPIEVTGISLPSIQTTLKMGSKLTLTPTISPSNATNREVNWISSDEEVATVNEKGVVTPLLPGVAIISATTVDGNFYSFTVVYVFQGVNKVTLSQSSLKLKVGDDGVILTATVNPDNVQVKDVKWSSSNPNVAIVGSNGVVIPVAKGSAVITATSVQDNTKSAKCSVTVDTLPVKVTGVTLASTQQALKVGSTLTLKHTVSPSNAANKAVVWNSSDETVAKVSSSGIVTAVSKGIATIKVKTLDGNYQYNCIVTITQDPPIEVTGISLPSYQTTLKIGSKLTLTPTISPSNATNKGVNWSSSDEAVATVTDKGVVTPLIPGVAVIRATTVDGNFSTLYIVYVVQGVNKVTLSQSSLKLKVGDGGAILTATVSPDNVQIKDVKWTSSNPNVAIVSQHGVVVGISKGTAVITATSTSDSTKSAKCSVTVTVPVSDVIITK